MYLQIKQNENLQSMYEIYLIITLQIYERLQIQYIFRIKPHVKHDKSFI